ncbi:Predicted ATP-dependent endonuclease of the OLD family, contains P-loop ATPase and TOPRIM domains [Kosakonia oryzendophytica]|uniref:Predicted ATP-dependent endonuclease of the OLD family, contains P-loop ATPase and TOPRIM domains n=1 Tax=Kosakonia oryzendophytica TaxID=1005665 RepID=A0A1C4A0B3_9ENTR|nr:retron Eco8 family effector endonuclease [Kosakonia oryzendophytica]SCB88104.1 Predicted ATP-dependent endonuclease of the OLD family, contains P-loop ATPase and TOPRIM domains [Kosakonia oryzendophytica]
MTIKSIEITNLLSFDSIKIDQIKDINCIVGKNNAGKSNLLKLVKFFYDTLDGKESLPPKLHSNYSYKGAITLTYDTTRIYRIARKNSGNKYFNYILRKLIPAHMRGFFSASRYNKNPTFFTLTLHIYSDNSIRWSTKDKQTRDLILYLYPFFHIEPRHMNLHDWDSLWDLVARLKSFNLSKTNNSTVIEFFDKAINTDSEHSYKKYIEELNTILKTQKSTQKEKILSYIKAGLKGYKFEIEENELIYQSDGTNSFHFIKTFLNILITIAKREYITPFVFIDEPELGLHPKMNEMLIKEIYRSYAYKAIAGKTPNPKIIMSTHSSNIVKEIIKSFRDKQSILFFRKNRQSTTHIDYLNSTFNNESFINIFSDNEARLYFSKFILFVEGETEQEVFGNAKLAQHFPNLNEIDVYKSSSNIIGERVNPSYANSSIPYLFLFDADKAWKITGTPGNYTLSTEKNGNYYSLKKPILEKDFRKYSLGYNPKYIEIAKNIKSIIDVIDSKVSINETTQRFVDEDMIENFRSAIKKYLLLKNFYINQNTFEGCLININSASLFYKWLEKERGVNIKKIKSRVNTRNSLDQRMLLTFFRVIFNGKTDSLWDYSIFNLEVYANAIKTGSPVPEKLLRTSLKAKRLMAYIEKNSMKNKSLKKTDGWATSFINFALDFIEAQSKRQKKSFNTIFKFYFPEFHDIIQRLQPDS